MEGAPVKAYQAGAGASRQVRIANRGQPTENTPFPLPSGRKEATPNAVDSADPNRKVVLVVDGASSTCIPLTDHLRHLGFRCDIQGTARGTLDHLGRVNAERWPRLAMIHFPPVDSDGLEFLATLRQRHPSLTLVCYADISLVGGIIFDQAERMNVRFLSLPFDFQRIDALLAAHVDSGDGKRTNDGPFFGTSRHVRGHTSRYNQPTVPPAEPESAAPATDRRDAAPPPAPPIAPVAQPRATSRLVRPATGTVRRSVDTGVIRRDQTSTLFRQGSDRFANPGTNPGTARIRRGVTGRISNPAMQRDGDDPGTAGQRRVQCASCQQIFHVAVRPTSYTLPCMHCGTLNRIDPL